MGFRNPHPHTQLNKRGGLLDKNQDRGAPQPLFLEMGEALVGVVLRVLRLSMLPALHLRGGADERLHAHLALGHRITIIEGKKNTRQY